MIASFQHEGLRRFFESGNRSGIQPWQATRLKMLLLALDSAEKVGDLDVSGFNLHPLKGMAPTRWSVSVSGNWRLTFEFSNGNTYALDYEDYH